MAIQEMLSVGDLKTFSHPIKPLLPFADADRSEGSSIPMPFRDYLELLDMTGRITRRGKRGSINPRIAPILERLNINESEWLYGAMNFEQMYRRRQSIGGDATQVA